VEEQFLFGIFSIALNAKVVAEFSWFSANKTIDCIVVFFTANGVGLRFKLFPFVILVFTISRLLVDNLDRGFYRKGIALWAGVFR